MIPIRRLLDTLARWWATWHLPITGAGHAAWRRITAPQLFVGSFAAMMILGAVALRLLPGLYVGEPLGWRDAFFTAASAVSVTGLVVVDTATRFTMAGQAVLLLLLQLGGLGMLTFTSVIIVALGRRLSVRNETITATGLEAPHLRQELVLRHILYFTLAIEGAGALLLWLAWGPRFGWGAAAWPALFHAVSAFCNAGLSTFSDNLIAFQRSPATLMVMTALILAGGTGFLTMTELLRWRGWQRRRGGVKLSLHSRLALATTLALLVGGWLSFAVLEWGRTLAHLPAGHRIVNALFMSASVRTAGFNTVNHGAAADSSNFLSIILMFIGGSPGSTAGGIKTTTVAILVLLAWSRLRGRDVTAGWRRSIPEETVQRAVGLTVAAFALVTLCIFLYTFTEGRGDTYAAPGADFLAYMFEAVSAFNTNGLTMGVTDDLTPAGRWITIVLMFLGRVGPLTLATAFVLAARRRRPAYRDVYEDVVVG